MIEKIENKKKLLSIIIRANYESQGIEFFTPNSFSQQLAYMKRDKNYIITPHTHEKVQRNVQFTQEVLLVRKGKVRVDYYDDKNKYLESRILNQGDVVLLAYGGHGFEMIEDSEMIEIKQGPYIGKQDKINFETVNRKKLNIKT